MRWQIENFVFDANNKVLALNNNKTLLEPKTAALLTYFCKNPNQDITRDQLLKAVWHGQIVSDNSINRAILLLRKALGDEDKIKKFIVTVPKVGYRFIVLVRQINDQEVKVKKSLNLKPIIILNLIVLCIVGIVVSNYFTEPISSSVNPSVSPLMRLAEGQNNASMANDGRRFIYTSVNKNTNQNYENIYLVNPTNQIPIVISAKGGNANFGLWSHDDSFIIYLYKNRQKCEFHQVNLIDGIAQNPEVIYQCNQLGFTEFALSADNTKLFFIENTTALGEYKAYELDMIDKTKRLLSQPLVKGIGSFSIDIQPKTDKLLLVSDLEPGKSTFFELNVNDNTYSKIKSLNYSVYSAIWSHRPNFLVHPAQHPSYQLIESEIDSDYSRVLVSDSRRIRNPKRIKNSQNSTNTKAQNYLFTSYLYNRDIVLPSHTGIEINSSVMDYLPAIAHDAQQVAFISKRSGYSKVWIKNLKSNQLQSIEPPDKGRTFYDLSWSFDDKIILTNTDSGLLWFDTKKLSTIDSLSLPLPAYGVGWYSKNEIVYSLYENNRWNLYTVNIHTKVVAKQDDQWAFVMASPVVKVFYDQNFAAYQNTQRLFQLDQCGPPVQRFRFKHVVDGTDYYCLDNDKTGDLLVWKNLIEFSQTEDFLEQGEFFSVSKGIVAKTRVANANSDIMRTNF